MPKRETELEQDDVRRREECIQSNQLEVYRLKTNAKTELRKSQIHIDRWRCEQILEDAKTKVELDEHKVFSCLDWSKINSAVIGFQQHPQDWVWHATGALLSDSALCVALLPSSNKRTVKWLFQSPHSPEVRVQPTSCTGRNRKCVKRSLPQLPWLSYVHIKIILQHLTKCSPVYL